MTAEEPQVSLTGRYSPTEAAKILQIARATVYKYVQNGKVKIGLRRSNNRMFIPGTEIMKLWKAQY